MGKLNWKLFTKKRGSSTQGLPVGSKKLEWIEIAQLAVSISVASLGSRAVLPPTYWPAAKCIAEKFTPTDCTHFARYRTPWWAFHFVEKRAICGSAVFLTDIFQLEWRLGFVPYFRVSGSCCRS
jgi:hypothetical protein